MTSITGYRQYENTQGSDTDYTQVDILYRTPGENAGAREFTPPYEGLGSDWVLVLDDAARGYAPPGRPVPAPPGGG